MSTLPPRFKRNALSSYGTAVASLVLAVAVTPILARGLGKEAYGIWGLATSTVLYFDLLKFGFGRATVKYVAAADAVGDTDGVRRTITTSAFTLALPGLLVLLVSPLAALLFPVVFDVPDDLKTAAIVLVLLSALDMAVAIPADTLGSTLIGYQRYDLLNATLIATSVGQASAWAVVIALDGGLVGIGVATVAFSLSAQAVRYVMCRRLVGERPLRRRDYDRRLVKPLLSMSGWVSISEVSDTIIDRVDAAVVGIVAGVPQAAVYMVGQKLAALAARFTTPVTAPFFPHASALAAEKGASEALKETIYAGTRISLAVVTPLMLVLAVLAAPAIDAWVGTGFEDAALVVVFLSAAQVIATVPRTPVYVLRGMGNVRGPALIRLLEAALNLPLSVALGLTMGFQGVALGTLIAAGAIELGVLLPYSCRKAGVSMMRLMYRSLRSILLPSLASLAVGVALQRLGVHGLIEVIGVGLAMLGVYVPVLFVTGLSAAERRRLGGAIRQLRPGSAAGRG